MSVSDALTIQTLALAIVAISLALATYVRTEFGMPFTDVVWNFVFPGIAPGALYLVAWWKVWHLATDATNPSWVDSTMAFGILCAALSLLPGGLQLCVYLVQKDLALLAKRSEAGAQSDPTTPAG